MAEVTDLRIALFGATGSAGSGVLRACLKASAVSSVVAITRRPLGVSDAKLVELHVDDFFNLRPVASSLTCIDACFYCLGTASAGVVESDYRRVTKTYALEAARALQSASPAHTFHFLSGSGTNLQSRLMWARVKAETEEALKDFGLAGVVCYRPAMILSKRLPSRAPTSLRLSYPLLRLLKYVRAWSVDAYDLGLAMLQTQLEGKRAGTLENTLIRDAADRYRASLGVRHKR